MQRARWFKQLDQSVFAYLTALSVSVLLMQPVGIATAQSGFEFTGENCIEAYDQSERLPDRSLEPGSPRLRWFDG
jgi:hypothetical protein